MFILQRCEISYNQNALDRFLDLAWNKLKEAGNFSKFLFFLCLSFLIRFPFFFRDYIDRDESTFILLGQSLVDGHLPYTQLWDLKPPFIFFLLGTVIALFGKSFMAIRITAVLVVASQALVTYLIALRFGPKKPALFAGILTVYLCSLFGSVQGLMSEHVSTLFFMFGIYILLRSQKNQALLYAGIVLGCSLMTKSNTVYALGLLFLFQLFRRGAKLPDKSTVLRAGSLGLGILIVIAISIAPYFLSGQGEIWLDAVYFAPLAYTQISWTAMLKVLPLGIIIGVLLYLAWHYKTLDFKDAGMQLLILMLLGIVFSFFRIGKINGHYMIQIYPILLVLLVAVMEKIKWTMPWSGRWVVLGLLLVAPIESYLEGADVIRHRMRRGSWFNGEGITVPKYLTDNGLDDKRIFFLEYHIGYWVLGQEPPSKAATHPSNICRSELFPFLNQERRTGVEELEYIMEEVYPEIVIVRQNRSIFDADHPEENAYIDRYLETHFTPLKKVDNALILIRSQGQ